MLPHVVRAAGRDRCSSSAARVACFAGYRLFRVVLGDLRLHPRRDAGELDDGRQQHRGMLVAALVGGIVGALILVFAYFVGIALVGAGLGALIAHVGVELRRRPAIRRALAVIVLALVGAIGAMVLQRYVIIVATAFGGAWTMIVGGARAWRASARPRGRRRRRACGFSIRHAGAGDSAGCRSRGSRSAWSAPRCSWASRDARGR